jgi:hypothetical protein
VIGHDCPCGTPHELGPAAATAFQSVTAGLPSTVTVQTPDGRFAVPRIFIACHGLKAADLPALAARYGFERTQAASGKVFYVLICRECGDPDKPLPMPFESPAERGKWAAAHTAATGHDSWFVIDQTEDEPGDLT